jgi:hypothetical protein
MILIETLEPKRVPLHNVHKNMLTLFRYQFNFSNVYREFSSNKSGQFYLYLCPTEDKINVRDAKDTR